MKRCAHSGTEAWPECDSIHVMQYSSEDEEHNAAQKIPPVSKGDRVSQKKCIVCYKRAVHLDGDSAWERIVNTKTTNRWRKK